MGVLRDYVSMVGNIEVENDKNVTVIENMKSMDEKPMKDVYIESKTNTKMSLDDEKSYHKKKASKLEEKFKAILSNTGIEFSFLDFFLYPVGIAIIGFCSTLVFLIIPTHDLIQYPEYWYENIFQGLYLGIWFFIYIFTMAASLLNLKYLVMKRKLFVVVSLGNFGILLFLLISNYLWKQILGYQYPIPFQGFIVKILFTLLTLPLFWFTIPPEWRKNEQFLKRIRFFFLYIVFNISVILFYQLAISRIRSTDAVFQPFAALILPVMRELFIWIGQKLVDQCSCGDGRGAKIFHRYTILTRHTIALCYVIGAYVTETTQWVLMGVDFSLNISLCSWIVWKKKRHSDNIQSHIDLIQELAINELVEFHAPLSFILVIAVAYHGPNAKISGNIGNSYWTYTAIDDIEQTLKNIALFFFIDFGSTIISSAVLWLTYRINLWMAFNEMQREFWKPFCLILGYKLIAVSKVVICMTTYK